MRWPLYKFHAMSSCPGMFVQCQKGSRLSLPVGILYVSMKSPLKSLILILRSLRLVKRSLYGRRLSWLAILVALLWAFSGAMRSCDISYPLPVCHASRCGLTYVESRILYFFKPYRSNVIFSLRSVDIALLDALRQRVVGLRLFVTCTPRSFATEAP